MHSLFIETASHSVCVCVCTQLCQTLSDPMDYRLLGSSVHGTFQARILKWVAISYFRGSSRPRDWTHISCGSCTGRQIFLPLVPLGNPAYTLVDCQLLSHVQLLATLWTAARQASLSFAVFRSLLKLMSIESVIHSTISSSVDSFSSCPQSFPASRSFLMSELFASGSQSIGASASVLPMNVQDWFP